MTPRRWSSLPWAPLLVVWGALCAAGAPPEGDPPRPRKLQRALEKASKKLEIPVEVLAKVGGHRVFSRRPEDTAALVSDLHGQRDPRLLPLLCALAQNPKLEIELRCALIRLLPVYALEGDSGDYLALQPVFARLYGDEFQRAWEEAADANLLLLEWFDQERAVEGLFAKTYRGKFYRKAQRAYRAVLRFQHPELRSGVALEALREAFAKGTRFGIQERNLAVRENGLRGEPLSVAQLAELVHSDGTIAVACAQALGELGDRAALPSLRTIGRTSSHALRIPVLIARGRLQDESLATLIGPTLSDDHASIQVALLEALALVRHEKVDAILAALDARLAGEPELRRQLDLLRLGRGDPAGLERLAARLAETPPDARLARQVVALSSPAADPLLLQLAQREAKELAGPRRAAVARLGTRRQASEQVVSLLRGLCQGKERQDKTPLRLQAAASLLQLGVADAAAVVTESLADFEVVRRVDVKTAQGKGRRYAGSHLSEVAARWARDKTWAALPLVAPWLDPLDPKGGAQPAPVPAGGETRTRGGAPTRAARPPARHPKWLAHAFVRRDVVEALAELCWAAREAQAGRREEPWPEAPESLPAWRRAGEAALARALDDSHALVRRAAIRGLARLADHALPPGADAAEEARALKAAEAYLATLAPPAPRKE